MSTTPRSKSKIQEERTAEGMDKEGEAEDMRSNQIRDKEKTKYQSMEE